MPGRLSLDVPEADVEHSNATGGLHPRHGPLLVRRDRRQARTATGRSVTDGQMSFRPRATNGSPDCWRLAVHAVEHFSENPQSTVSPDRAASGPKIP